MAVVVHKYGGSSVSSPEKIHHVADRVVAARRAGDLPVVVVSAMGRTTDELLALAKQVSDKPHRRELDMLLTCGERASMALLAMAIGDRGCDAVSLTGSQAGIITTTDHNQARIIEVRPIRVHEALEQERVVIVGGFAGVSTTKEVTTLGRGGSDTTAIALAAALNAEHCDIFSDVDGVYTADPRVVPDARRIDAMAHGEIQEMGLRGARVLAPEAIDYARRHGVELRARSTFGDGSGTVVTSAPLPGRGRAVAVCADPHVLGAYARGSAETLDTLFEALERAGLSWKDCRIEPAGDGPSLSCSMLLDTRNSPDAADQLEALRIELRDGSTGARIQTLQTRTHVGTVTLVGEGLAERAATWRLARGELRQLGLGPISMWASSWGLTALLPEAALDDVVRAWHAASPGLGKAS